MREILEGPTVEGLMMITFVVGKRRRGGDGEEGKEEEEIKRRGGDWVQHCGGNGMRNDGECVMMVCLVGVLHG